MISKMDNLLGELSKERQTLQQQIDDKDKEGVNAKKERYVYFWNNFYCIKNYLNLYYKYML